MDDLLAMTELIQPLILALVTVIGWGVKAIWNKVRDSDKKIDDLRNEIRAELQEYERKETCRAHREALDNKIKHIATVYGVCMTKTGMAVVDINNVRQMSELRNMLSPELRKQHTDSCQFKQDMDS
ncbi:MAG: hypothetical protein IJU79_02300 [Desulfovibrionaceae bacterium]|nr:hypothetical protein [Desulfovibrionaceae bacterium]